MIKYLHIIVLVLVISSVLSRIKNNDVDCYNEKLKTIGVCIGLKFCDTAINLIKNYEIPQMCRYEEGYPITCCPLEEKRISDRTTGKSSIAERKCKEYQDVYLRNNKATDFSHYIIGGKNTTTNEFPHMVSLGYGQYPEIVWLCGGTLISERFIITAAHCVKNREYGDVRYAQLGDNMQHSFKSRKYLIKNRYIHPEHEFPKVYHDIALLELKQDVGISKKIRPACLFTNSDDSTFKKIPMTSSGWGVTSQFGDQSEILQKVTLNYFGQQECNQYYKRGRKLDAGIDPDIQLCYGSKFDNKDTCQGDSGGPLTFYDYKSNSHKLVGVVSFGNGCGTVGTPGVYVRVSYYVPWIESIIWPNN